MGPETRNLLEENLRLAKENNRLLRALKRAQTIGLIFKILWIAIFIGIPVALYIYVLEPYYMTLQGRFGDFQERVESIPGFGGFFGGEENTKQE